MYGDSLSNAGAACAQVARPSAVQPPRVRRAEIALSREKEKSGMDKSFFGVFGGAIRALQYVAGSEAIQRKGGRIMICNKKTKAFYKHASFRIW
jgi:hypothetical protein